jgi:hypothetical protein
MVEQAVGMELGSAVAMAVTAKSEGGARTGTERSARAS